MSARRVAVLGLGAIGLQVLRSLRCAILPAGEFAVLRRPGAAPTDAAAGLPVFTDATGLLAWKPRLAIECAGHSVVAKVVPGLLRGGVDVIVASLGALADPHLRQELEAAGRRGGGRLFTVAGAIGGLDALQAACAAGVESVRYRGCKPPLAWLGTPAEQRSDLAALRVPTAVFEGDAATAARLYPKNANVTAAVALAGVGFERTQVTLVADPGATRIVHELEVCGAFGRFFVRLENNPFPENPRTSWLAALSIEAELRKYFGRP